MANAHVVVLNIVAGSKSTRKLTRQNCGQPSVTLDSESNWKPWKENTLSISCGKKILYRSAWIPAPVEQVFIKSWPFEQVFIKSWPFDAYDRGCSKEKENSLICFPVSSLEYHASLGLTFEWLGVFKRLSIELSRLVLTGRLAALKQLDKAWPAWVGADDEATLWKHSIASWKEWFKGSDS